MEATLEITMYPLRADYEDQVIAFLRILGKYPGLRIVTNAMSTQVQGEFSLIFSAVQSSIQSVYRSEIKAAFIIKVLPGALDIDQKFSF